MTEEKDKVWSDPNKVGGKYMASVIADFAPALKEIAKLGSMNNKPNGKYERGSWKLVNDPEVMYGDAFWRHLLEGPQEIDIETGMPHDVAIAWNALALLCFRLKREEEEQREIEYPESDSDFLYRKGLEHDAVPDEIIKEMRASDHSLDALSRVPVEGADYSYDKFTDPANRVDPIKKIDTECNLCGSPFVEDMVTHKFVCCNPQCDNNGHSTNLVATPDAIRCSICNKRLARKPYEKTPVCVNPSCPINLEDIDDDC